MNKDIRQDIHKDIRQLTVQALLDGTADYIIPIYQRDYAWDEAEIKQLIQDVLDKVQEGALSNYYIGTLVVSHKVVSEKSTYEVIDGQQRLTTLFLLASYFLHHEANMCWFTRPCVRFESRERSSKTLSAIFDGRANSQGAEAFYTDDYHANIIHGYELVKTWVPKLTKENGLEEHQLARYLFQQVKIMRVEVPEGTDLNHYFETMNNRGEQLEKHEILKSRLMAKLDMSERSVLHKIWEACANMERYVQMEFSSSRNRLFGEDWNTFLPRDFDELKQIIADEKGQGNHKNEDGNIHKKLSDIVNYPPVGEDTPAKNKDDADDDPQRFSTIVDFPNFLLHVLRATVQQEKERQVSLDDKQLLKTFDNFLISKDDCQERIKRFVFELLKLKFLYDQFIIKRDSADNKSSWSLKRLKRQKSGTAYYADTFRDGNRRVMMLLSALHVSSPAMVYKHWLNAALHYLYKTAGEISGEGYLDYLESISRCFVYDLFLSRHGEASYFDIIYRRQGQLQAKNWDDIDKRKLIFGQIANNLVFNYLDYLLWLKYKGDNKEVLSYKFSFRSSVEHYYPQNPWDGEKKLCSELLHSFGNLCLISHNENSKLSNRSRLEKWNYCRKKEIYGSVKQWLMMRNQPREEMDEVKGDILQHNKETMAVFKQDLEGASGHAA